MWERVVPSAVSKLTCTRSSSGSGTTNKPPTKSRSARSTRARRARRPAKCPRTVSSSPMLIKPHAINTLNNASDGPTRPTATPPPAETCILHGASRPSGLSGNAVWASCMGKSEAPSSFSKPALVSIMLMIRPWKSGFTTCSASQTCTSAKERVGAEPPAACGTAVMKSQLPVALQSAPDELVSRTTSSPQVAARSGTLSSPMRNTSLKS
mmetsp:Transcript_3406/g.7407  ORF Transcript_3406/g.7407 Transcript_3406/m.7407 type:complete len:210 (-) Transcript_3406:437-1066(-)